MLARSFYPTGLGLGLGFFEEDLDSDLDLTVAGLVTSLVLEVVEVHVRVKFHQAMYSGS